MTTWAAVLGGVSVAATAGVLRPLLVGSSWWAAVAVTVAVVVATGWTARRLRAPWPVVMVAQVLLAGAWVVVVGAGDSLRGGMLPTVATPGAVRDRLAAAFEVIDTAAPPVVTGTGMLLLVCAGLGLVAVVVDHLVVTWRVPALAAIPLLGVHLVTMICAPAGVDGFGFTVSAAAYLALVLFAPGRSTQPRAGGAGVRVGLAAVGLALVVAAAVPGLGVGAVYHLGYHQPSVDGEGVGDPGGSVLVVTDPLVQLRRNLNQPDDVPVLTYRTSDGSAPYLRLRTLEQFDGRRWTAGPPDLQPASEPLPPPSGLAADVPRTKVTTTVRVADGLRSQFLPIPYPASAVRVAGPWRTDVRDLDVLSLRQGTTGGLEYSVDSAPPVVDPNRLRQAADSGASIPADIRSQDLALPGDLPPEVAATARRVTAGAGTDYDRAVALQDWFRTDFTYDAGYREGTSNGALSRFLSDKRGYCEQFAATMAVMARQVGIPARVVTGFLPGASASDGTVTVTARDAHAWPELWFPGYGWLRFEPTPATRTGNAPAYATPTPTAADPASPPASASAAPVLPQRSAPAETAAGPAATTQPAGSTPGHRVVVGAAVVGAVAVVLLAPHLGVLLWWRRRRAAARARGGSAAQVELAWDEVRSALAEAGSRWEAAASPREAARQVLSVVGAATAGTSAPTGAALPPAVAVPPDVAVPPAVTGAVGRLVQLAERVRYAAPDGMEPDLSTLRADVATVVQALRAVSPRRNRLAGFLLPEPVRRRLPGLPAH